MTRDPFTGGLILELAFEEEDHPRDEKGRFGSGGGGGGSGSESVGGDEVGSADSTIAAFKSDLSGKTTSDYQVLVDAEKQILARGPKFEGFEDREGNRLVMKASGDEIKNAKVDAKRTLAAAGYELSGKSKMLGGSETIDSYRNPKYPNHRYTVHTNPRTRGGVKEAVITIKVET